MNMDTAADKAYKLNGTIHPGIGAAADYVTSIATKIKAPAGRNANPTRGQLVTWCVTALRNLAAFKKVSLDWEKKCLLSCAVFCGTSNVLLIEDIVEEAGVTIECTADEVNALVADTETYGAAVSIMCSTKATLFKSGHHIGQGGITGAYARASRSFAIANKATDTSEFFNSCVWVMGHWLNTLSVWKAFGVTGITAQVPVLRVADPPKSMVDRFRGVPCGQGKFGLASAILKGASDRGVLHLVPNHGLFPAISGYLDAVLRNQVGYHDGANFFRQSGPVAKLEFPEDLWQVIGEVAHAVFPASSLAKSPSLPKLASVQSGATYMRITNAIAEEAADDSKRFTTKVADFEEIGDIVFTPTVESGSSEVSASWRAFYKGGAATVVVDHVSNAVAATGTADSVGADDASKGIDDAVAAAIRANAQADIIALVRLGKDGIASSGASNKKKAAALGYYK